MKKWIQAFRLRTLPLSLSSILLGSFLAASQHDFKTSVFVLAILTTVSLQILSNLANDYGDGVKGTDNSNRVGPKRAVQSGAISPKAMLRAVLFFAMLSLVLGITLLYVGLGKLSVVFVLFLLLGLVSIGAAIKYTVGKNAYGYMGMGDIAVFLFFGITGVVGTFYLHTGIITGTIFLPASAVGLLAAGVLNVNNMRDRENDALAGKRTLVVMMGIDKAKIYHTFLVVVPIVLLLVYTLLMYKSVWQWLFVVVLPMLVLHLRFILQNTNPALFDTQLKRLAITTLLIVLTFGTGLLL